jgi:hypothetical protein
MVKRGIYVDKNSLLGKDHNNSLEMTPIGRNKYLDIFNATNILYEELRQKCILKFNL